jgi:hypothetical protein
MDEIVAAYPGEELHGILDNLNTHKNNEAWLERHPNVRFHFTPTSASWLNQSRSGSRSCRASRLPVLRSHRSNNCADISMISSRPTTPTQSH